MKNNNAILYICNNIKKSGVCTSVSDATLSNLWRSVRSVVKGSIKNVIIGNLKTSNLINEK
jgi:hypothetical protein